MDRISADSDVVLAGILASVDPYQHAIIANREYCRFCLRVDHDAESYIVDGNVLR